MKTYRKTLTMVLLAMLALALIPNFAFAAEITVTTDKASYLADELVTISGVADANALVGIQVKNPADSTIYTDSVLADGLGAYESILSAPSTLGTYTVYVSAPGATASKTFIVSGEAIDTGTLSVNTTPFGEQVFVDGVYWGMAPVSQDVEAGTYTVSFGDRVGYITPDDETAVVTAGEITHIEVNYEEITGDTGILSIDTTPVKGAVYVNGALWGTAPQSRTLAAGTYTVSYGDVSGYIKPSPQTAVVTVGETTPIMGTYVAAAVPTGDLITKIQRYNSDTELWEDWATAVQKGDEIRVVGKGVTAGATVNVYFDNAMKETFTAGSGKVASGTAKPAGTFSIKFLVPEGLVGTHYVWVKDVATGKTDSIAVTIAPKLAVSPSSGLEGDSITLTGSGYGYNDDDDKGLEVTIDLSALGVVTPSPATPKTNSLGTWTATFKVPKTGYSDYYIYAEDSDGNEDVDGVKFKVGSSITLSISEGPVGSVVTITGRGFEKDETLTVNIGGDACHIVSGDKVRSDGRISTKVVIPYKDLGDEESIKYTVTVKDAATGLPQNSATAKFTVNGEAEVKATPSYGIQGAKITVEGWNFTRISGTEVLVTLGGVGEAKFKTDSKGYFKGAFQLPAVASEDAELKAEIGKHYIVAMSTVRVGVMLVILTPDSGPSGALVSVTGVGFEPNAAYTVKIGEDEWFTGTATDKTISESKNVPSLEPGTYTVTVIEDESEIEVTATLTVTEKTEVTLSPAGAPNEYEVTIEGWYFAEDPEDASLEFALYNSTSEWILDVTYKMDTTSPTVELGLDEDWDDGYFKGKFTVPKDDSISIGSYTLNVTDGMGMFAQMTFEVVPKTTQITPRKATFRIGETVAFNVESSFKQENAYIKIFDPAGNQYWRTDAFELGKWTKIGDMQVYAFYQQTAGGNAMILMEDAPLGTYTWKWYDKDAELLDSGTFSVAAAIESLLGQQITDLNEAVTDLQTEISTVSTAMAGVQTQITNAVNAANAAVTAANAATQAVNAVAQTASAASTAAQNAANAANEARNAANGLTTLVYGAIGASLVAALAAIVSLMQISRRIAG